MHESWPLGRVRHYPTISSTSDIAYSYCKSFYEKLKKQNPVHPALSTIELELDGRRIPRARRSKHDGSWLVLPFHPQWKSEVEAAVRACFYLLTRGNLSDVAPRVSWSLCGPHLFKKIRT